MSATPATRVAREVRVDLPYFKLAGLEWAPGLPGGGGSDARDGGTPFTSSPAGGSVAADDPLPVLALHGWLDNAASFLPLIPFLPADRRIVALDLPGHGLSSHRPQGAYSYFLDYVPVVFDVADALGWERFALIGHSMGAGIGTLAAGTFPERIDRLILIDGMGPLTEADEGAPARFRSFLQSVTRSQKNAQRARATNGGDTGGGSVYATREHAVRARKLVGGLSDESARLLVERNLTQRFNESEEPDGFIWRTDARLKLPSPMRLTEKQVRAFLSEVEARTLMIAASDSEFAAYENLIQARAASIRKLSTIKLTGGHHLHMENPEPVARAIAEFLEAS